MFVSLSSHSLHVCYWLGAFFGGKKKQGVDPTTWEAKKASYKKETWHLALARVLADLDAWSLDATKNQHELMLSLMESIWQE